MASTRRTRPAGRNDAHRRPASSRPNPADSKTNELAERITAEIRPLVEEAGLYLENVRMGRGGQRLVVKVVVDLPSGPGGVDSDTLTDVSRAISQRLDDVDLVEGAYTLEVSTPGAERDLTEPRHFSRAQGRLVAMKLTDGTALVGRLESVNGDTLNVLVDGAQRAVAMEDVEAARVRIDMSRAENEKED